MTGKERGKRTADIAFVNMMVSTIHPRRVEEGERIGSRARMATDRRPIRRDEP